MSSTLRSACSLFEKGFEVVPVWKEVRGEKRVRTLLVIIVIGPQPLWFLGEVLQLDVVRKPQLQGRVRGRSEHDQVLEHREDGLLCEHVFKEQVPRFVHLQQEMDALLGSVLQQVAQLALIGPFLGTRAQGP